VYHQPLHLIRNVQGLLLSSSDASPSIDYLSLVSRLGCPGSTLGRGTPFPNCLLFSKLGCLGSTPSRGIPFPDYLLLFSRLGYHGNTLGRGIPFPECLLLFSPLHCTQSPGTVTHLSSTQQPPPPPPPLCFLHCCNPHQFFFSFLPSFLFSLLHCHNQQHQFFLTTHYQMSVS